MKKIFFIVSLIILFIISFLFIFFLSQQEVYSQIRNNTVLRVIDGDTFEIYNSDLDDLLTIRLLCVDTPEKGQEGYENSIIFLQELILGKKVVLEKSITDKDNYGRFLRYVYVDDVFVNKLILDKNYGKLMIIPPEICEEFI